MVIEQLGTGEIDVDGKITKVGPGSVMYTTPDVFRTGSSTPGRHAASSSTSSSGRPRTRSERMRVVDFPMATTRGSCPSADDILHRGEVGRGPTSAVIQPS